MTDHCLRLDSAPVTDYTVVPPLKVNRAHAASGEMAVMLTPGPRGGSCMA